MAAKDSTQIHIQVPLKRVWKAFCDPQFLPKALPGFIESVEILEGDGICTGSIRKLNFGSVMPHATFLKEKIEKADLENYTVVVADLEGGAIGKAVSSSKFTYKFSEGPGESTILDWEVEYVAIVGAEMPAGYAKDGVTRTFKAIENYLIANPEVCAA